MEDTDDPKVAGQRAVAMMRRRMARGLAAMLRKDPRLVATAVETGLVSRDWLDDPGNQPISAATPVEVVERYLERQVEQRPSMLSQLGLSAIQILSWRGEEIGEGPPECLAVAFTDLVGFTAYTAEYGDDAASELLGRHYRTSGPIVRSRGGRVMKKLGDGLLLVFPSPEAAVLGCLELAARPPAPLGVRAGVHMGDVVQTRDDVVGHVVNVAARVTELASAGDVWITSDVADAVADLPQLDIGRARHPRLKGIDGRTVVHAVTFA